MCCAEWKPEETGLTGNIEVEVKERKGRDNYICQRGSGFKEIQIVHEG